MKMRLMLLMLYRNRRKIILIFMLFVFLGSGSALAEGRNGRRISGKEEDCQLAERNYRHVLREFLHQAGYENSGINMTRIVIPDDTSDGKKKKEEGWVYTVFIHHKKIGRLEMTEMSELMTQIVNIEFPVNGCTVHHEFLF